MPVHPPIRTSFGLSSEAFFGENVKGRVLKANVVLVEKARIISTTAAELKRDIAIALNRSCLQCYKIFYVVLCPNKYTFVCEKESLSLFTLNHYSG